MTKSKKRKKFEKNTKKVNQNKGFFFCKKKKGKGKKKRSNQ